jgi:DNA-binding NtrC family response regulator
MKTLLQILIVEDSEDDALLVLNRIKKGSYSIEYKIIDNALEMRTALNEKSWDLVLSDYSMPNFNGLKALDIIKESGIDIPFILISGTIGEEIAVEAMKAGAHDYIMKNNLHRLLPAIERELRDAKCREEQRQLEQKQKRTENELRESEERNRLITENTADTITMLDLDFNVIYTSPSVKKLRGFKPQEAM